jgi:hypothetical protein
VPKIRMPTPIKRKSSPNWWFRKKVPLRLRELVGKTEIWYSLQTHEDHIALARCAVANAEIEQEWAALLADSNPVREPLPEAMLPPTTAPPIRPPRLPAPVSGPRHR